MKHVCTFDLDRLRAAALARRIVFEPAMASTNDRALALARQASVETPLLVLTERQTAGRGRGANRWWAAPGALTFSLLIDPAAIPLEPPKWPQVSLAVALAVREVVARHVPSVPTGLRWPNDVFVDGRKIAGVLVEVASERVGERASVAELPRVQSLNRSLATSATSSAAQLSTFNSQLLIVGVGLNANNSLADAPSHVRRVAASLTDLTAAHSDLTEVLLEVLEHCDTHLAELAQDDPRLPGAWQRHCLLRGRTVGIDLGTKRVEGRCHGIDSEGALLVETGQGIQRFFGGTITRVSE